MQRKIHTTIDISTGDAPISQNTSAQHTIHYV